MNDFLIQLLIYFVGILTGMMIIHIYTEGEIIKKNELMDLINERLKE
jgi:hypothetical protein